MLLRPDATFIDGVTKRAERIFPVGIDWQTFESHFPNKDVFANSVLDPAIGIVGDIAVQTFAAADWRNWISSMQVGVYELATRIGLPELEGSGVGQGLAQVYTTLQGTVNLVRQFDDPAELVPELVENTALQVLSLIVGQTNLVGAVVMQVIQVARWAFDVARDKIEHDLGKNVTLPPLQSEDPATDTWQVNRVFEVFRKRGEGGIVFPDGKIEPASNADYTGLFLPAYRPHQKWRLQHRDRGVAAQQGMASSAIGPAGRDTQYSFDIGDGSSFGFMPGTTMMLRVLQASYRSYFTVRSTPVDRYTLRCKGVDKPCWKSTKTFDGSRDCRQCVDAESVWPVKGIGWAYGGAPLNATTPGENVGAFYPSANKLLLNLLDTICRPGPLMYTVDAKLMHDYWKASFERFWEFAQAEWTRYRGAGWRGMISRLATMMTAYKLKGEYVPGGRELHMPVELIASPRASKFEIPFEESIFSRIIEPFCRDLAQNQLHYLHTVSVAYIPPGVGALYRANGKVANSRLADRFMESRRELLNSNKRMIVDLRQVSDPKYREALRAAGVKVSPVNAALQGSPGVGGGEILKPDWNKRRPPRRPKVARVPPLRGAAQLADAGRGGGRSPLRKPVAKGPRLSVPLVAKPAAEASNAGIAVGVAAGAAVITAAVAMSLPEDE